MHFRCPNCRHPIELTGSATDETQGAIECPSCSSHIDLSDDPDRTEPVPDIVVDERYQLQLQLGQGSFGKVYKAWDNELLRTVAIKLPRPERAHGGSAAEFLKEARSAAVVSHPNVVQVHEVGKHEKQLYIISQFIEGADLHAWLKDHEGQFRPIAQLLAEVADGVHAAHEAGVIHRDLKPGNILVDQSGTPFVTDFGLARRRIDGATVTRQGDVFGTPKYMSPEQASGRRDDIDRRSDVFSLGSILYLMLTGVTPFEFEKDEKPDQVTILYRISASDPVSVRKRNPSVPRDLETICMKCLEKRRADRYESAQALAEDLRRFIARDPVVARPIGPLTWLLRRGLRYPRTTITGLLAFVAMMVALFQMLRPAPPPVNIVTTVPVDPAERDQLVRVSAARLDGEAVSAADWAVFALDPQSRIPDSEPFFRADNAPAIEFQTKAGDYLVVTSIPGYGFHEVFRHVPESPEIPTNVPVFHLRWDYIESEAAVVWPTVIVHADDAVEVDLVSIPGGDFLFGRPSNAVPSTETTVEPFFVESHEVTMAQGHALLNPIAAPPPDSELRLAQTQISFDQATFMAEISGCRLVTEPEFAYLATDLGQDRTPMPVSAEAWEYGDVTRPDRARLSTVPVFGILDDVAEWVESGYLRPEMVSSRVRNDRQFQIQNRTANKRITRGGPVNPGSARGIPEPGDDPRFTRDAWDRETRESEIGFRRARSAKPRGL